MSSRHALFSKMATSMSWQEARDKLKKWREDNTRNSIETVELGQYLLDNYRRKLGDEVWTIYEQVCIAALDCGDQDLASDIIDTIEQNFPSSIRGKRLEGLQYESLGEYEAAKEHYEDLLKEDPSNAMVRKRLIALLKGQNRIGEAIKELNSYLQKFMSDHEAWMELADLYISEQNYSKASFCFEELIISNPHNHLYHQKYAEIQYTQGGTECMEIARKYFAHAVKLNGNNMRALYGMFMAATNIASSPKASGKVKKDNMKYAAWAAQQIAYKYKVAQGKDTGSNMQHLEKMLDCLQITPAP
ncbi:ER membrane protein complex subunit 2-like [Lytechinus variegatus]|uniref:ER membrane protein complex subunit 2-like n=1 Tax=Lytechinus variegatus TaxID=7654 RepID=UPI001BB0E257|nr:ER membrane protein complex subunit 2-like [Lytechinus variegatus]XP_041471153.1 ER membrane protein complex subunit 2-like [Lytechinus variegatus]